ncbi:hypothetical protein ACTA71_007649 [Dictyostelium dimigraforme]
MQVQPAVVVKRINNNGQQNLIIKEAIIAPVEINDLTPNLNKNLKSTKNSPPTSTSTSTSTGTTTSTKNQRNNKNNNNYDISNSSKLFGLDILVKRSNGYRL